MTFVNLEEKPDRPATSGLRRHWGAAVVGLVGICILGFGLTWSRSHSSLPPGLTSLGTNAHGAQEYRNEKDASVLVRVPSGSFPMGADGREADSQEGPVHRVMLGEYFIGKHEVTNEQFERFVLATGYDAGSSWREYSRRWGAKAPVVFMSWDDAKAYCEWAGGRLPTEAEWEKAARGTDARMYPWGNAPPEGRAWFDKNSGGRAHEVGSAPAGASPYGCQDMAGNVWEWCQNWFYRYPGNTEYNEAYGTKYHTLRGGCWAFDAAFLRSAFRLNDDPDFESRFNVGFRLAVSASPSTAGPLQQAP